MRPSIDPIGPEPGSGEERAALAACRRAIARARAKHRERRARLKPRRPAAEVLAAHDAPEACHYVDPPYPHSTRPDVRGYSHEMSDDGHRELAGVLRGLAGAVVLSGYRCPLHDELYGDWERVDRQVLVFRTTRRTESLWLDPRAAVALPRRLFD